MAPQVNGSHNTRAGGGRTFDYKGVAEDPHQRGVQCAAMFTCRRLLLIFVVSPSLTSSMYMLM